MKQGYLSQHFEGVAAKRLSAVESDPGTSNQHELNGVSGLKKIFGERKTSFSTRFLYFEDEQEIVVADEGTVTWYDSRESHPTRSEFRLYFSSSDVSAKFAEGDLIVIGKKTDGSVLVATAKRNSTAEKQLIWLFGLSDQALLRGVEMRDYEKKDSELDYAAKYILEELGIEAVQPADNLLGEILAKFGGVFPPTKDFSAYARSIAEAVPIRDEPDKALITWIQREEELFRALERHIVRDRISKGFGADVDSFISFSLSVQNRRKARMGQSLENHLAHLFTESGIRYSKNKNTEGKKKPDFLFPGVEQYHDPKFPAESLTMLGAKSSCKERWRQVLSEAGRITEKHLITLEPGISVDQTKEMQESSLQLVVPDSIHKTYSDRQRDWLMSVKEFISFVRKRQS
ncbi:restriction endonuclease [Candidatus Peribacteria bacterium RIFOXYC2_FULL_55_14]|nr:MAG: Type II restriction enzyme [Candidatus Peribacteria bacterium GW2011_GWC2_54_8]KKW44322.1 MAG: Type II restriction enzyme [Candidatus Peregrinibacteria bacterium GW2011_GWA2_54_9]OGJ71273.1 MAG: restriction endonuclease [Candidatus Peribacteria bacterium RIFOXYA1_FULL_56_14]OGJ74384.1 MAG: restriction endonuclease [Candidatus Peribacteria bacterium RIFOXYB1_FULL_54_35]OGJ75081.1 MAG: restriction endonuclease [Candidatus Peribacteria bacterium RIFOXYA2_FULL_55_28]OGJ76003.1 MAG: restric